MRAGIYKSFHIKKNLNLKLEVNKNKYRVHSHSIYLCMRLCKIVV